MATVRWQDLPPPPLDAAQSTSATPSWQDLPAPPPEQPGMLRRAAGALGGAITGAAKGSYEAVRDAVTGNKSTEFQDAPEAIPTDIARFPKWIAARAAGADNNQLASLIVNEGYGDIKKDKFNNLMVRPVGEDKWYYMNKPGLSMGDVDELGAQIPGIFGAGKAAKAIGGGLLRRAGTAAAVGSATSIAQDTVANALGSDKGIDLPKAAIVGGLTGGFEFASPAIGALVRRIRAKPDMVTPDGKLTQEARKAAADAGVPESAITPDFEKAFADLARKNVDPQQAAAAAQYKALPVPLPVTKGTITGSPVDQMFESQALKGAYGDTASSIFRNQQSALQEALRGNIPAIQSRLGGGIVQSPGQGATTAQAALLARQQAEAQTRKALYDTAKESNAFIYGGTLKEGASAVRQTVEANHSLAGLPRTQGLLQELDGLVSDDAKIKTVPIGDLFAWRKRASSAARGNAANEEGVALRSAIRNFDGFLDDAVERALVAGDDKAINAWKQANKFNREYSGRWKGGDLAEALVEKSTRGGEFGLRVAPEDASKIIFNSQGTGFVSKKDIARDVSKIKDLLGEGSEGWNALREESFLRFAQAGEGAFEGGTRQFSGVNFKKAWDNARLQNPALINSLYSKEEQALVTQFANAAAKATNPVKGGENYSNTMTALANSAMNMRGIFGDRVFGLLNNVPVVGQAATQLMRGTIGTQKAISATNPRLARINEAQGSGAAIGNIYATQGQ